MQIANGTGLVTAAVLYSDDADEIDLEFSGSNFGAGPSNGKLQTNVFAKGMTGNYDRGTIQNIQPPQTGFHTYSMDWTPDKIDWIVDGVTLFTHKNTGQKTGNYQFPQTPSRLHVGMWDAGDPDTAGGTRNWAGGYTDYSKTPYTAYLKWVKISTPYPCKAWKYPDDFSGSWSDVKCTNETIPVSTSVSTTSTAVKPKNTEAEYTVVAGDNGYSIADKLGSTFDQLSAANPKLDWDMLLIGQKLKNPNAASSVAASNLLSSLLTTSATTTSTSLDTTTSYMTTILPNTVIYPSSTTSTISSGNITTGSSTTSSAAACKTDDCLKSMLAPKFAASASMFCSQVRLNPAKALTELNPMPGCGSNALRIRSACNCLHSQTSAAKTTTSMSSSASVQNNVGRSYNGRDWKRDEGKIHRNEGLGYGEVYVDQEGR